MKVRVILVDAHELIRRGVAAVLSAEPDLEVVAESASVEDAVALVSETQPDVVIMEPRLPGTSGLEAAALLCERHPDVKVLVLTASEEAGDLHEALRVGAQGYVLTGTAPEELVQAVRQVARGWMVVSPAMAQKLLTVLPVAHWVRGNSRDAVGGALSIREWEVLQLLADGLSNREIADQLVVSENTIKTHMRSILSKLRLKNRAEAAVYARAR